MPSRTCIYCGSTVYSCKPDIRTHPLGAEHIVPEGLGGTLVLPESSCQAHEETTGARVEGDVLGRTLKALRVHLKLKKRGSRPHPKSLILDATIEGKEQKITLPIDEYPIILPMLRYATSSFVADNKESGRVVIGSKVAILKYDEKNLFKKYKITDFRTESWDSQMFCRMLAKIGHSFAVAELGIANIRPMLLEFICNGDLRAMNLVGGEPTEVNISQSDELHELDLGFQRFNQKTYVIARIRLFAKHGGLRYYVVVGKSPESSIVRAKRVLLNRFLTIKDAMNYRSKLVP